MRPYDGQAELLEDMAIFLGWPSLDAEWLGRIVLVLDWFVCSGLVTQTEARAMLADRRGDC